eukprot:g18300.t1
MSDTVEDTILSQGGVRVLVGDSPRDRAETSSQIAAGHWPGTGMGSVCPVPPTGEECETIQCENAANCLDRFIGEAQDTEIGTAVVECNGKQGRYVTIELYGETRWERITQHVLTTCSLTIWSRHKLPGVTSSQTDVIRSAGLTEARVEGGPAQPTEDDVDEEEQTTSDMDTYLIFGGVAFVLVAVIGVFLLGQGGSQGGRSRPVDAAAFAENEY